nr:hypothetical protein [uncultured Lacibacter sp.]
MKNEGGGCRSIHIVRKEEESYAIKTALSIERNSKSQIPKSKLPILNSSPGISRNAEPLADDGKFFSCGLSFFTLYGTSTFIPYFNTFISTSAIAVFLTAHVLSLQNSTLWQQ